MEGGESDEDVSFLRTHDLLALSCTVSQAGSTAHDRVCLAAEGFGNRMCFLENLCNKETPADLSVSVFILDRALSVRALQEMISAKQNNESGQSGHRTLLYGHAILLQHQASSMYLTCLSSSSSRDKLAFDVGLEPKSDGEACWWTIHPASKQRSEGEKVRIGDDFILVSVASERYLHFSVDNNMILASFQQTLWSILPCSNGVIRQKIMCCIFGNDILRLLHGDECLTISQQDSEDQPDTIRVMFETGDVETQARSLWRMSHVKQKWSGAFFSWGCKIRIRHVTSGRYLGVLNGETLTTVHRTRANDETTVFIIKQSKDEKSINEEHEEEGMGCADIHYGETVAFLQHESSGLWLSYKTYETKKRGIGRVEEKQAIMLHEGHMDDGFTFTIAQPEESKSASAIRRCASFFNRLLRSMDSLTQEGINSENWRKVNLHIVEKSLKDLIDFFVFPSEEEEHEQRQMKLKALKNRQGLFQEEGMINLILDTIDRFGLTFKTKRDFVAASGEEYGDTYDAISNSLYVLVAAIIRGNRTNCAQFAQRLRLDWLFSRLDNQQSAKGVLDVLHCILTHSPEALNMIRENHIETIVSMLDRQGRDERILDVFCSLCVGNQSAVRLNQNLISKCLLPDRNLLLQTRLVDNVACFRPNVSIRIREGAAVYTRWYFEVFIDNIELRTSNPPHLRIGWANNDGFLPYPGGGYGWGNCGLGDDIYSFAFDGQSIWNNSTHRKVRMAGKLKKGDVIGCALDLTVPRITFTVNGTAVRGYFKDFNRSGTFYPCVSLSAKVSARFLLGGQDGRLKHGPPESYSPVADALLPNKRLRIESCFSFGQLERQIFYGPNEPGKPSTFVPVPADTSAFTLSPLVEQLREKLAENYHELWAMHKIEQGWQFGETRDDQQKRHPNLISFAQFNEKERQFNLTAATQNLRTIIAFGYNVMHDTNIDSRVKTLKLGNNYLQANGYKPLPLDLTNVHLPPHLDDLVFRLAENIHNVWARDRIKQGWTYGLSEDFGIRRSPHLVPFNQVDLEIQRSNKENAAETLRTIIAYGFTIERCSNDMDVHENSSYQEFASNQQHRTYRAQTTWAVTDGKWYYELELLTEGLIRCGWISTKAAPGVLLGDNDSSYAFDCASAKKWHGDAQPFGKICRTGDVIGCFLDMQDRTISFSLNGELMMDAVGQEIAFKEITSELGYIPGFTLSCSQQVKLNLGNDVKSLKFFTCCGLQEGYQPFCVNMCRAAPLWYDRIESTFIEVSNEHSRLGMSRSSGGIPTISVSSKLMSYDDELEFLRLSLPLRCKKNLTTRSLSGRRNNLESMRRKLDPYHNNGGVQTHHEPGASRLMVPKDGGTLGSHSDTLTMGSEGSNLHIKRSTVGGAAKRSKSPFGFFKKTSRHDQIASLGTNYLDASSGVGGTAVAKSSGYKNAAEMAAVVGSNNQPPIISVTGDGETNAVTMYQHFVEDDDYLHPANITRENSLAEHIEEYYYSVRVFPGQDPGCVWIGWLTSNFKAPKMGAEHVFATDVKLCTLDNEYRPRSQETERTVYMVNAGDILSKFGLSDDVSKRLSHGMTIGCILDVGSGQLSFDLNGREIATKVPVVAGSVLYPAVAFRARGRQVCQFELGRTRFTLPVISGMLRGPKQALPQLPNRLTLQVLDSASWARLSDCQLKVLLLKLSEIRGWSLFCEEPAQMLAVRVPEEERCYDILELEERPHLLNFHSGTLEVYRSICCHGNIQVARSLTEHVDEKQFLYALLNPYLAGSLRLGYYDLLIEMHLENFVKLRLFTKNEFIIPLSVERSNSRTEGLMANKEDAMSHFHSIPREQSCLSIRTNLTFLNRPVERDIEEGITRPRDLDLCPPFSIHLLKEYCIKSFLKAVETGDHIRDPIGGTFDSQFVPLLRVINSLLSMGCLSDKEMNLILSGIHAPTFNIGKKLNHSEGMDGLLDFQLNDVTKLELCRFFHQLCDMQLQHRVESLVAFAYTFVADLQADQLNRYLEIKNSNLPSAVAARKTKEFRCPPYDQMNGLLQFTGTHPSHLNNALRETISVFHDNLLFCCGIEKEENEENENGSEKSEGKGRCKELAVSNGTVASQRNLFVRLLGHFSKRYRVEQESIESGNSKAHDNLASLIKATVMRWANSDTVEALDLLRSMFTLLYRQYNVFGEIQESLAKTYVINTSSREDVSELLLALGRVRCLIGVQVCQAEEDSLKKYLWRIMNNTVFFQHPDLIRCLGVHETVMQLMIHTLNKSKLFSNGGDNVADGEEFEENGSTDNMIVMCCRFLCYFCRTSMANQAAMFEHLSFMLDNATMLLVKPSLRGTCPLDVAYSSFMDNNELALALEDSQLERISNSLSRCGVQSNTELLELGYPDIGWDPVEGERFLDFLRFCVWVNGESVEENASLVVRLLIRKPECLGPALRGGGSGGGGGLLRAIRDGITMSIRIALHHAEDDLLANTIAEIADMPCVHSDPITFSFDNEYDFNRLPPPDHEDYIDIGGAILTFYSVLVDLLGRCSPDPNSSRADSLRMKAILRSLVSMEDLEGVLSLRFVLLPIKKDLENLEDCDEEEQGTSMPPGLLPEHKSAVVLFMERIYGIEDETVFFRLLEKCFLPDMRDATTLDAACMTESDIALALNRYLGSSVLPLLSRQSHFFSNCEGHENLFNVTLHTAYKLSKCCTLTKGQRDQVCEFLVALTEKIQPCIFTKLLNKIVVDVPSLAPQSVVPLRVLTVHYEQCGHFYSGTGRGGVPVATEQEKSMTMKLFSDIFDALATKTYDPELFGTALPCLASIACALSPDYSSRMDSRNGNGRDQEDSEIIVVDPNNAISQRELPNYLKFVVDHFAEHFHDTWAVEQIEAGWQYAAVLDETARLQPSLKPFHMLSTKSQAFYRHRVEDLLCAVVSMNWKVIHEDRPQNSISERRHASKTLTSPHGYNPTPLDLRNITLRRDLLTGADKLANYVHTATLRKREQELLAQGFTVIPGLIAYELLTQSEKERNLSMVQELLKYLQIQGINIQPSDHGRLSTGQRRRQTEVLDVSGHRTTEHRFAYKMLNKLLQYVERAFSSIENLQPSERFNRTCSYAQTTQEIKFFGRVVLPLVEKYFDAHKVYFVGVDSNASSKEKEITCILFCKLYSLLRSKMSAFVHDAPICVRCLKGTVRSLDIFAIVKNSPEISRAHFLPFFNKCADDIQLAVSLIKRERFSHVKGTIQRGASSLTSCYMIILPVLKTLFEHIAQNKCGSYLMVGDVQLACYKILSGLYSLGSFNSNSFKRDYLTMELDRHRPLVGECVAAFASTFPVAFLEPEMNRYNRYSIMYGIEEDGLDEFGVDTRQTMTELVAAIPLLPKIVDEIAELAEQGGKYSEAPHVIEITLPMLCSYLPFWWKQGPDNKTLEDKDKPNVTEVTAQLMNNVLGNVLLLVRNNLDADEAPWMTRIAMRTQSIVQNATAEMLSEHFLPVAELLKKQVAKLEEEESAFYVEKKCVNDPSDLEEELQAHVQVVVRNMFAYYPLLIRYVDLHRATWLKVPTAASERLFSAVADTFLIWTRSFHIKREEQNFVAQNEINPLALIMSDSGSGSDGSSMRSGATFGTETDDKKPSKKGLKKKGAIKNFSSLVVACAKRLTPVGLSTLGGREQELVQRARNRLANEYLSRDDNIWHEPMAQKELENDVLIYIKSEFQKDADSTKSLPKNRWQKALYQNMGNKAKLIDLVDKITESQLAEKVFQMAKILHGLYIVDHPPASTKLAWKKLVTLQRKRAIMACFRMLPLHALPRHRVLNLFLLCYKNVWLLQEEPPVIKLINDLTDKTVDYRKSDDMVDLLVANVTTAPEENEEVSCVDALKQLIVGLSRYAGETPGNDPLYIAFAAIMSKSCSCQEDDDDDDDGDEGGASFEEQEMTKQQLLSEQGRLAERGAAEMVLLYISASNGEDTEVVRTTIDLGISICQGGNTDVQKRMLKHLKEKQEVGFFTSIAGLMQQCTVLDLNAFERYMKAQDLGVPVDCVTIHDSEFTCKIFRFLQLLCEGHFLGFQDYLRSQTGSTISINIIICTVDYLLRLQESMMDFYWHYSGKDVIEKEGKVNFVTAIKVGKQIFNSLTEYIQGPCVGNQHALAHSRLWDAIGGFLYIFAYMQEKLSKDAYQLELLRSFMSMMKEMLIMLISMLEGNVVGGPIGKQMVDTLVESTSNVEMILKFFEIFLKMKDLTSSEAFLSFDVNGDGVISHKEFRHAMEQQKMYTDEEIEYVMMCVDANQDGKVDFNEFTDRFHNPAKDIGFNLAVLLTNLSEHMPASDNKLERIMSKAQSMQDYFEPYLGRIEIMGSNNHIERVYFEITQTNIDQWNKPQIKESKRSFLHSVVNEGGDKEKLESFVNFCEDTIFEMQHAQQVQGEGEGIRLSQVKFVKDILAGEKVRFVVQGLGWLRSNVRNSLRNAWNGMWNLTLRSLLYGFLWLHVALVLGFLRVCWTVVRTFGYLIYVMAKGNQDDKVLESQDALAAKQPWLLSEEQQLELEKLDAQELLLLDESHALENRKAKERISNPNNTNNNLYDELDVEEDAVEEVETPTVKTSTYVLSLFAKNFYNFKMVALCLAFVINFILLFFRAQGVVGSGGDMVAQNATELVLNATAEAAEAAGGDLPEPEEWITLSESLNYLNPLVCALAFLHSVFSFSMLIGYYCLKVPLVVFKREKEISRMLEFEGMWVSEQPSEDNFRGYWDKLVLSTPSFPNMYWDKFIKKKVLKKFQDQYDSEQISNLLGMNRPEESTKQGLFQRIFGAVDVQYFVWKLGVIFTDNSFLYLLFYLITSVMGNFNYFFFACHLLDVAISFKTLRTILQSVTHNGKQLVLTVMLTCVIIYLYTVLAFNFFRKFYIKEEDGKKDFKCHDMLTCFVFHLHTGLRAGGGIGDEIESPDGDPYEVYRILFDITFFFFVIVILLAIIQGLIIDAFGELRDQLAQVTENMESMCFICGIGKEFFDKQPRGFEVHTEKEHNFANYMFFLMHLINKPDTEYTGQETYVWELYQQRLWQFFPVGDCFRKQYEEQLAG